MNTLRTLFAQKSWANNELFNLLATVPIEQHSEALRTAIRTLNHVVDQICFIATNTETTPQLGDLHFEVAQTDAWWLA